jgi:phosphoribosylformimino-5-aminoimidazole carboxamide ribotide isomerase
MQIIPAIDIIDGKCVRLTEGDYTQKTEYAYTPLDLAKMYEDSSIERLHLVDLDGAKAGKVTNWAVAESIVKHTKLVIDFGGGVKTVEEVRRILDLNISYVTVGSVAAKQPEVFNSWVDEFGAEKFMLGADVRGEHIMVSGWMEKSDLELMPFLKENSAKGIRNVFCTDVSKDGRLEGPATELYRRIKLQFPELFLIASGGVSQISDLYDLQEAGCDGVIIGKAIYENRISMDQLKSFIQQQGN